MQKWGMMQVQRVMVASVLGLGLCGCGGEGAVKAAAGAAGSVVQGAEALPAEGADKVAPGVKMKALDAARAEEGPAPEGEAAPAGEAEARVAPGVKMKQLDAALAEEKAAFK